MEEALGAHELLHVIAVKSSKHRSAALHCTSINKHKQVMSVFQCNWGRGGGAEEGESEWHNVSLMYHS